MDGTKFKNVVSYVKNCDLIFFPSTQLRRGNAKRKNIEKEQIFRKHRLRKLVFSRVTFTVQTPPKNPVLFNYSFQLIYVFFFFIYNIFYFLRLIFILRSILIILKDFLKVKGSFLNPAWCFSVVQYVAIL